MKDILALSLGLAGLILALPAAADPSRCGPRDQVVAQLTERYGESPQGMGLVGPSAVMELYASEGGSWTITVTSTQGVTCLLAAGDGFQPIPQPAGADGSPA